VAFVEIRARGNPSLLLCRYDPERQLLEIKPKGLPLELVDLTKYQGPADQPEEEEDPADRMVNVSLS
jgi:hypothetical protein